ncbi:Hypothetical predicted protein [Mytilus galloprovincialis]|uniref:Uncharacterized protein n=1 Tax=Mytilus galloprovincialis TaxID=29158 RepID=A0A8B6H1N6_MYTGA|nr:Hypothetical predicted protein [Mytilus galloprovincialis]
MTGANEYFGKGPQGFGKGPEKVPKSKENYVMEIKRYSRDCTIRVIGISTENVQAISVIRAIEHVTGLNSVLAVVKDDTSSYDVTLDSKSNAAKILSGVEILDKDYECSLMYSDTTVVSFMYIPAFIDDDDIIDMLRDRGIKIVSPVFRRVVPGTQVADGTRFVKCVFPPHIIALPWSMPFKVGKNTKYYKCVHNNQTKESEGLVDNIHNNKIELIVEAAVHMENIVQHETRKRKIANSEIIVPSQMKNTDVDVKDDDGVDISAPSVSAVEEEKKDEKTGKKVKRNGDSTLLGGKTVNEDLDLEILIPIIGKKRKRHPL